MNKYTESCEKAKVLGYKEKISDRAYNSDHTYYEKDGLKWIYVLDKLAHKLGISESEAKEKLKELGYNIDDYYAYVDIPLKDLYPLVSREELLGIFSGLPFDANGMVYLSDGMYMTEEGDIVDLENK